MTSESRTPYNKYNKTITKDYILYNITNKNYPEHANLCRRDEVVAREGGGGYWGKGEWLMMSMGVPF